LVTQPSSRVTLPVRPGNGHVLGPQTDLIPLELSAQPPTKRRLPASLPLLLGLAQVLVVLVLVWVELAEPRSQPGLKGFIFSNAVSSEGATNAMRLYRTKLSFLPLVGKDDVLAIGPYQWARRIGLILLAVLQLAALWAVAREDRPSLRRWVVGPAVSVLCLLLYPPINTDVFYYASVGLVANHGENPYFVSPKAFGPNVFDKYSDWEHITAPYGPVWVWFSRAIDALTSGSPFWGSLGYKLLLGVSALGLAYVTARLARRLTCNPRREVLAFVLVAWSPIVLYESAGTAHVDPLLMMVALSGLLLLTTPRRGAIRCGLVVIGLSALFKLVTVPLLGAAALVRLTRREDAMRTVFRRWFADVIAVLALVSAVTANIWEGGRVIGEMLNNQRLAAARHLKANPFWFWLVPKFGLSGGWLPVRESRIAQTVAILVVAAVVVRLIRCARSLRRGAQSSDPTATTLLRWQIETWAAVMVALAYIPPNSHSWYMIWALPLMTLVLVDRVRPTPSPSPFANGHAVEPPRSVLGVPWWLALYFAWSFTNFFLYHTSVRH
jgi:hypothetical protein